MQMRTHAFDILFDPLASMIVLTIAGFILLLLVLLSIRLRHSAWIFRLLCGLAFLVLLINPLAIQKERSKIKNVVAVIVDRSASQTTGERMARTDSMLAALHSALERPDIELRVAETAPSPADSEKTELFKLLDETLADVPQGHRGGAILLTDGQVHDVPAADAAHDIYGPVHVLLSGDKNEKDRRIVLTQNPAYGVVGEMVRFKYIIADQGSGSTTARLSLSIDGHDPVLMDVPVNAEQSYDLQLEHAGPTVIELQTPAIPGELSENNNSALVSINGIRDRMRVLLVTGQPYAGGRTWRDLLKSDPNIDLVQFTILRDPDQFDATPENEMALVAFPFRELFEVKLKQFDLVIFDHYRLNRILPDNYFANIRNYVEEGGAFFEIDGPDFSNGDSLYNTDLAPILPGTPGNEGVVNSEFIPALTSLGKVHPVTRTLTDDAAAWGPWLRQLDVQAVPGSDVLMSGAQGRPLLLLSRAGQGRVAQLTSDQIWLWARHYKGGGPHADLLKRVIHWLMKEPALDEKNIDIAVRGQQITLRRAAGTANVEMITPDKKKSHLDLIPAGDGYAEALVDTAMTGVYSFNIEGGPRQYVMLGNANTPEYRDLFTTDTLLKDFASHSGGRILWMQDIKPPRIALQTARGRSFMQEDVLNFRDNQNYDVTAVREIPAVPEIAGLCALLALLILCWRVEGRTKKRG